MAAGHELAAFFLSLKAPPRWGTLRRSADGPPVFYSFGPWPTMRTITEMPGHPCLAGAIGKSPALCEDSELGTDLVAATAGEDPGVTYQPAAPLPPCALGSPSRLDILWRVGQRITLSRRKGQARCWDWPSQ